MLGKIFKFLIVLIVLAVLGVGIYLFFDRSEKGTDTNNGRVSLGDFFPFGRGDDNLTPITPDQSDNETPNVDNDSQTPIPTPRLWQISKEPQAGASVFVASSTTYTRFVDKATGNVFESNLSLLGSKRISNTTIPKIYTAIWQPHGTGTILQYMGDGDISSVFGKLTSRAVASSTESDQNLMEFRTTILPRNLTSMSANPINGSFAYIAQQQNGSALTVINSTAANPRQIYTSPIRDMAVGWINGTTLGLFSKPSSEAAGYFYLVKSDTGALSRLIGGVKGLTALVNPAATKAIYSESINNGFRLGLLNIKSGEKILLSATTLPEKCVWSKTTDYIYCARPKSIPSGKYPDHWYQGRISFNDNFWRIDTTSGASELIFDPSTQNVVDIDAVELKLDPSEKYLVFTNKKDSQLWGLKLERGS